MKKYTFKNPHLLSFFFLQRPILKGENRNLQSELGIDHDAEVEGLNKSLKDKQAALEALEKSKSRDNMIIKFRE